jgi:polysaccharide chain length determinant protein (PEP-CTERM system associated)
MERAAPNLFSDYVAIVRRRRALLILFCPGVLLIAVLLAFKLPSVYRSSGTILLEASSVPVELVRPTVVATYADQQVELLRQRVMRPDLLVTLVAEVDPYPERDDLSDRAKASMISANTEIERVDPITLEPLLESTAFSIHYNNPSPELAAAIATKIVAMFLSNNLATRTESATETVAFLTEQARQLEEDISAAESALSDFKQKHTGALPDNQNLNQNLLERAERDLLDYDRRIREAEQQRNMFRLQLREIPPSLVVAAGDWVMQLAQLRAQLAEARQRYTEEHPDVRRLTRSIETLQQSARANGAVPQPDNPAYLQVQAQLAAVERELSALHTERARAKTQVDEYSRRLFTAPEIEREYLALTRDYELAQEEYREIKEKLGAADMARAFEAEQRGERFTLIRSPSTPTTPHSPNRLGILLLGFVLAFGGGIGVAAIAEWSDNTVRGARDLRDILEMPPIGTVPRIYNREDQRKRHIRWIATAGVFAAIALIGGLW